MERRKGIPLVALVIFVALLVAIILTCVIILGANKKNDGNTKKQASTPAPSNEVVNSPEPVEDEEGTIIENEDIMNADSDIQDAYKLTGNGKTFAKYAIYSSGGFDTDKNNLKNDLKLQLAMAQVTNSDMDKTSTTKSVPKAKVEEYAGKVFSETQKIDYKDFSLYESDTNFTEKYKTIGYVYNKDKDAYEIQENDVTEDSPSEVTEIITKAVKYSDKIEIYVKPLFIKTFYAEQINGMGCEIFGDYNFQTKEYENSFIPIAYSQYNEILRSEYNKDLDKYKYSEVSGNIDLNQVKEYKYTLIKEDTGYKLKSFEEAKKDNTSSGNIANQMSEQEVETFNAVIKAYTGTAKKSSEVKMLLNTITTQNEQNKDKTDRIIEVTLENQKAELKNNDVEKLNEEIDKLADSIESDTEYTVREKYTAGLITSVTITK